MANATLSPEVTDILSRAVITDNLLVLPPGQLERKLEHRCLVYLAKEQDEILPDNGLIALLCDGVRLAREYSASMNGQNTELTHPEPKP